MLDDSEFTFTVTEHLHFSILPPLPYWFLMYHLGCQKNAAPHAGFFPKYQGKNQVKGHHFSLGVSLLEGIGILLRIFCLRLARIG